jgi:hypothetical protein
MDKRLFQVPMHVLRLFFNFDIPEKDIFLDQRGNKQDLSTPKVF